MSDRFVNAKKVVEQQAIIVEGQEPSADVVRHLRKIRGTLDQIGTEADIPLYVGQLRHDCEVAEVQPLLQYVVDACRALLNLIRT